MDQTDKKEVVMLNLNDIIPNKFQPREVFDDHALKELAVSIKEHGVIQPIIVREVNGKYEIIAGERRYKASALAGKTTIPAIVNNLDDKESSKVALLENLQRKDLNPIEEAKTYQKVLELDEMTQEELAKTMGKSQSAVANKLRLLQLNDDVKKALLSNEISERHARTLLKIEDSAKQTEMLKKVITEKMNVRDLEKEINELYPKEEKEEELTPVEEVVANPQTTPIQEPSMDDTKKEPENFLNSFLNNSPLAPTTEIKNPEEGYGEVKVINDDDPNAEGQILNYADINDDEDEEDNSSHTFLEGTTPDVNDIKNNSEDIQQTTDPANSSLDSLLNLPTPTVDPTSEKEKFRSPAEAIIKTAETADPEDDDKPDDYFKTPDLDAVTLPNEIETSEEDDEEITVDKAKEKIKDLIGDLRVKGLTIGMDEMDFPSTYQIILKIDKNQ